MHEHFRHNEHSRGGGGRHRARARRHPCRHPLVARRRPMHGYEIITELEARSGGRWRPSPGAVYPALEKMERVDGAIASHEVDGKREFELTTHGREILAEFQAHAGRRRSCTVESTRHRWTW